MTVRTRRAILLGATAGCVAAAVAVIAIAAANRHSTARARSNTFRVLQLNLCDSGIARCYTGRSVARAADVVRSTRPDAVTVNEVCRDDIATLGDALSSTDPGAVVVTAFRAAVDGRGNTPVRCGNGQLYGIGLLGLAPDTQHRSYGGRYPMQDPRDVEERVWLCVRTERYLCTTHLASTSPATALAQCRHLLRTAIPAVEERDGSAPVVVGGDLNLVTGRSPDPRDCLPAGFAHTDDGARQHVLAGPAEEITKTETIDLAGTTDHPGLLVDLLERG